MWDLLWVACALATAAIWGYRRWQSRHPILMVIGILFFPPLPLAYQLGCLFGDFRTERERSIDDFIRRRDNDGRWNSRS